MSIQEGDTCVYSRMTYLCMALHAYAEDDLGFGMISREWYICARMTDMMMMVSVCARR